MKRIAEECGVPLIHVYWTQIKLHTLSDWMDNPNIGEYAKLRELRIPTKLYTKMDIPKNGGGHRHICHPVPWLKNLQRAILKRFLSPHVGRLPSCHGFIAGRSTVTGAQLHVGQETILNFDIKGFFASVKINRIYGIWKSLGFNNEEAYVLTRATSYNWSLPEGAPTSPMIANLAARKLDRRLHGLADSLGLVYTRYADDMTISGPRETPYCLTLVKKIVQEEGFELNDKKTNIMHRTRRQSVTGLTVNERVSVPRIIRRKIRAAVHRFSIGGSATWNGMQVDEMTINGLLAYLKAMHPKDVRRLRRRLKSGENTNGDSINGMHPVQENDEYLPF